MPRTLLKSSLFVNEFVKPFQCTKHGRIPDVFPQFNELNHIIAPSLGLNVCVIPVLYIYVCSVCSMFKWIVEIFAAVLNWWGCADVVGICCAILVESCWEDWGQNDDDDDANCGELFERLQVSDGDGTRLWIT